MLRPRTLIATVTLVVLAASVAPAVAAPAKRKPTCKRSLSRTVAENTQIRVFTRPDDNGGYTPGTGLFGCSKRSGRVRPLALAFDDEYISSASFGLVRIRGRFVAFYTEHFDISCKAACPPDYESTRRFVNLVDVRRGTGFDVEVAARPAGNRLLVDAGGAIAWAQALPAAGLVEVRVSDAAGERALDSGAIAPASVALTAGGLLSWTNAGAARAAQLVHRWHKA